MTKMLHALAKRGMEAGSRVMNDPENKVHFQIPTWGILLLAATGTLYMLIHLSVSIPRQL